MKEIIKAVFTCDSTAHLCCECLDGIKSKLSQREGVLAFEYQNMGGKVKTITCIFDNQMMTPEIIRKLFFELLPLDCKPRLTIIVSSLASPDLE